MTARYTLKLSSLALVIALHALTVSAEMPVSKDEHGVAIKGYDPVAYFMDGKPMKGNPAYEFTWQNSSWHFTSADHRAKFAAAPERYAPRYGGFCAVGLSSDVVAGADPNLFKIIDGKLYLGYDRTALKKLERDPAKIIQKADVNWNRRTDLAAR